MLPAVRKEGELASDHQQWPPCYSSPGHCSGGWHSSMVSQEWSGSLCSQTRSYAELWSSLRWRVHTTAAWRAREHKKLLPFSQEIIITRGLPSKDWSRIIVSSLHSDFHWKLEHNLSRMCTHCVIKGTYDVQIKMNKLNTWYIICKPLKKFLDVRFHSLGRGDLSSTVPLTDTLDW